MMHANLDKTASTRNLSSKTASADLDIVPQVQLGTNQDDRGRRTVGSDLGNPLLTDVVKRCRIDDTEAQQKDVGVWVAEWSQ